MILLVSIYLTAKFTLKQIFLNAFIYKQFCNSFVFDGYPHIFVVVFKAILDPPLLLKSMTWYKSKLVMQWAYGIFSDLCWDNSYLI